MENEAQIRGEAGNVPPPPDRDLSQQTSVTVFFVGQLAHATDDFSAAQKIGGGGFGSVYKAVLPTGGARGSCWHDICGRQEAGSQQHARTD